MLKIATPGSKSEVVEKFPVEYKFPSASTEIPCPKSVPFPPKRFAQIKFPEGSSLQTKISSVVAIDVMLNVATPGSKSIVFLKTPATCTLPVPSTKTEFPIAISTPPIFFAQIKFPLGSSLETKQSKLPLAVKLKTPTPGSKSTVPEKSPVRKIFPEGSATTEYEILPPVPRN